MNTTQPAISYKVKKLEEILGVKLFVRDTRTIKLTSEAEIIMPYIENAVNGIEMGIRRLEEFNKIEIGKIIIGVPSHISIFLLTDKIKEFNKKFPKIRNNPYYNNTTNQSPIAGLCGKATNAKDLSTTNLNDTCKYNEIGGENASTTGNVYGIYDMAGGAWEYVAGIYIGETSNDNSSKLWDSNNSKYVDKYINTTGSRSTYYGNTDKYGDAVYETSSSGASPYDSWDSCHSYFPISSRPVFGRGGRAYLKESAGVFAFGADTGDGYIHLGFRPCLINLD